MSILKSITIWLAYVYWISPFNKKNLFMLIILIHKYFCQIDDFILKI
jgi:hypothetical protein